MEKNKIYDLPIRIFHFVFSISFLCAFVIAKTGNDESHIFAIHMLAGTLIFMSIIFRIFWGIRGTTHALFSNFVLTPRSLVKYFKDLLSPKAELYVGHNPASSWVAIVMMILGSILFTSGLLMVTKFYKYIFEDIHELSANLFLVLAIMHMLGVFYHSWKFKDQLFLTMVTGKKTINTSKSVENKTAIGVVFILILIIVSVFLISSYSTKNGNINLFNKSYNLVDIEEDDL